MECVAGWQRSNANDRRHQTTSELEAVLARALFLAAGQASMKLPDFSHEKSINHLK